MKILIAAVAFASSVAILPAFAAETDQDGVVTLGEPAVSASRAAAALKPFMGQSRPCGSEGDGYTCINLVPGDFDPKSLSDYRVRYPGPGRAIVTWQGNVTCYADPRVLFGGGVSRSVYEYYVNLAIKNDASAFVMNAPGSASVGEKSDVISGNSAEQPPRNPHLSKTPVTLSRMFSIPAAGVHTYHVLVLPDLRTFGGSSCSIAGGATLVQYVPQ